MYPKLHAQAPVEPHGHGSDEVQIDPSNFKEPLILQIQSIPQYQS